MAHSKPNTTSKSYFSEEDQLSIANAIGKAEMTTSGEIRIFVEDHCPHSNPVDRAQEVFHVLKMNETAQRNGVLIYLAMVDKKAALYGDSGIYEKTGGQDYWDSEFKTFLGFLSRGEIVAGIEKVVADIGFSLDEYFPYTSDKDKNELPDEIVFGDDLTIDNK